MASMQGHTFASVGGAGGSPGGGRGGRGRDGSSGHRTLLRSPKTPSRSVNNAAVDFFNEWLRAENLTLAKLTWFHVLSMLSGMLAAYESDNASNRLDLGSRNKMLPIVRALRTMGNMTINVGQSNKDELVFPLRPPPSQWLRKPQLLPAIVLTSSRGRVIHRNEFRCSRCKEEAGNFADCVDAKDMTGRPYGHGACTNCLILGSDVPCSFTVGVITVPSRTPSPQEGSSPIRPIRISDSPAPASMPAPRHGPPGLILRSVEARTPTPFPRPQLVTSPTPPSNMTARVPEARRRYLQEGSDSEHIVDDEDDLNIAGEDEEDDDDLY